MKRKKALKVAAEKLPKKDLTIVSALLIQL